jgi:hypothetical protein
MRKISCVSFAVFVLLTTIAAQTLPQWIRFAPPGAGFVIMVPSQPKEEVDTKPTFTTHIYTVSAGRAIFMAAYGDYAAGVRIDPQKELEANRDNFNKGLNARLIQSQTISMDGRQGLEFTSETAQVNLKSRVFLVGNRVFQLATLVYKGSDESRNVEMFLDSFAFTTKL